MWVEMKMILHSVPGQTCRQNSLSLRLACKFCCSHKLVFGICGIEGHSRTSNSCSRKKDLEILVAIACENAYGISILKVTVQQSRCKSRASFGQFAERESAVLPWTDEMGTVSMLCCLLVNELAESEVPKRRLFWTLKKTQS